MLTPNTTLMSNTMLMPHEVCFKIMETEKVKCSKQREDLISKIRDYEAEIQRLRLMVATLDGVVRTLGSMPQIIQEDSEFNSSLNCPGNAP